MPGPPGRAWDLSYVKEVAACSGTRTACRSFFISDIPVCPTTNHCPGRKPPSSAFWRSSGSPGRPGCSPAAPPSDALASTVAIASPVTTATRRARRRRSCERGNTPLPSQCGSSPVNRFRATAQRLITHVTSFRVGSAAGGSCVYRLGRAESIQDLLRG